MNTATATPPSPSSWSSHKRRGRGILAMVTGTPLPCYPYNPTVVSSTSTSHYRGKRRRRHARASDDVEGRAGGNDGATTGVLKSHMSEYDAIASEFTIFYFADSTCKNCWRFNPILAKFLHDANSNEDMKKCRATAGAISDTAGSSGGAAVNINEACGGNIRAVECICVPNDTTDNGAQTLCNGMGVWCLPFDHDNRLAIIR